MRFTFSTLAYPHLKIDEVLERAKKFGLDGVELRVADDGIHLKPHYPIGKEYVDTIRSSGVKIVSIAGYARFSSVSDEERKRNEELLKTLTLMAEQLEAKVIRVFAGRFEDDSESSIKRISKSLNKFADYAEKHGIYIAIETHDELSRLEVLLRLLKELDPRIKILYDPANMIMLGEKHETVFPYISNRIVHVHMKDFVIVEGKRVFVRPGKGVVPICKIVRDLDAANYQGYISVEWEKMWHPQLEDPDIIIPLYIDYMKMCLITS